MTERDRIAKELMKYHSGILDCPYEMAELILARESSLRELLKEAKGYIEHRVYCERDECTCGRDMILKKLEELK